jgi:LysR family transcriptional regulator, chromosome initiation inhibitor
MTEIDLGQLQALAAVIDEGTFDRAALALHVTPSAISQRIKALETFAGRVLVRRTKPSTVTESGQTYLRLARQVGVLMEDIRASSAVARADYTSAVTVPLAVNDDSLATWVMPALATLSGRAGFDLHREDQDHSAALLRAGTVMAAITTDAEAIQGCSVTRLGTMRYRAMASPGFVDRWFGDGVDAAALAAAPIVLFDRKDDLQHRFLRRRFRRALDPPRHYVPGAANFAEGIRLGMGWGMLPDQQSADWEAQGQIRDLDPGHHLDVTLYWQQWTLETPILSAVADAIRAAAREALT